VRKIIKLSLLAVALLFLSGFGSDSNANSNTDNIENNKKTGGNNNGNGNGRGGNYGRTSGDDNGNNGDGSYDNGNDNGGENGSGENRTRPLLPLTNINCDSTAGKTGQTCTTALGVKFNFIPHGSFMMGAADNDTLAYPDEKPQHNVTLTQNFYMGTFELTNAEWRNTVRENNIEGVRKDPTGYIGKYCVVDDCPLAGVTYGDVIRFIDALNEIENITINGVRYIYALPTEAQWEYAARAGTTDKYWWGDTYAQAQVWDERAATTKPVGTSKPNPWGLYDTSGNVGEFVKGNLYTYSAYDEVDPIRDVDIHTVTQPAFKGGSIKKNSKYMRNSFHDELGNKKRIANDLGFRLVLIEAE